MPRATAGEADHRGAARVLVVPAARARVAAGGRATRLGEDRHRSVHPGAPREGRADAGPAGRSAHADPPRHARSHRARRRRPKRSTRSRKTTSPDAFAKVVDRLLASPRYGEAWGRVWLDVARYGEDDPRSLDPQGRGYAPYPNAYLYRDWVVKAFNDDLPYDQFVKAQIAGDLLDEQTRARTLPALGFLGLGPWYYDNGAVEITRADERHDRVDVVSRGFLGLTVACARCHDHKYDPIPTRDYYSLAGVFLNTAYHEYPLAPKSVVDEYKALEKKIEQKQKLLDEFLETESRQLAETLALHAVEVPAGRVEGDGRAEGAGWQGRRSGEARLRAVRSLDRVPGQAAALLSLPESRGRR